MSSFRDQLLAWKGVVLTFRGMSCTLSEVHEDCIVLVRRASEEHVRWRFVVPFHAISTLVESSPRGVGSTHDLLLISHE